MDLWLIAATGYITKQLQNVSKGKESFTESSSEDLISVTLESPRCLGSKMVRVKKPKEENFEDCLNEDLYECGNAYGVEVTSNNEGNVGNEDDTCTDSFRNRAFLRRNRRNTSVVKPLSMEKSIMSRFRREKMSVEEYMRSPFPSPCGSVSRPLLVSDGTKVISKNTGDSISQQVPKCGILQLGKLESSTLYVKRRAGDAKCESRRSNDAALLVGISIGIMSSFIANQPGVNTAKRQLKQTENLAKDLEDELKKKDSLIVMDDLHNGEIQCDVKTSENSESISKIEAELEAELERLEINMNSSNIETGLADVLNMDPDFEVEFAQGELRDDQVERLHVDETESNQEPSGNSTPESGNYTVSPRELSLRLYRVINSRYEKRIKELEIALQESQRKVEQLVMKSEEKKKLLSEIQPLVMNLGGEAIDAFNESYEELMDINDDSVDDLQCEMQENERHEEFSLTSKSSPWSHKDYIKDSSRTSEDVNFLSLQDLLGLSDEEEEDRELESEMEKQLIKKIVEKTKQGSSAVSSAQKMLSLMEEIEQSL